MSAVPTLPPELRADCAACAGLCCLIPPFDAVQGFGFDKPAQTACRHLCTDNRCGVHEQLADMGHVGCIAFDCLGAGQHLSALARERFGDVDWRGRPEVRQWLFDAYAPLRRVHDWRAQLWLAQRVAGVDTQALADELAAQGSQAPEWDDARWQSLRERVEALLAPLARK